jgi:hypothetical protein
LTFLEIDLPGVYVAPISLLIIVAWFLTNRAGHRPLIELCAAWVVVPNF